MNFKKLLTYRIQRQHVHVLAYVVFVTSVVVLLYVTQDMYSARKHITYTSTPFETWSTMENSGEASSTSPSLPSKIYIPSINISAEFETPLGLTPEGAVEVPVAYDTVGWYKYGPTPGEKGPAVIFGHVDTYEGPAVLYSLGQVHKDDEVIVEREDGSTVTFAVEGFERVKQDEFPNDRVYGNIPYAGIRIVTCSGVFDKNSQSYSHNLIVYGKLKSIQNSENETEKQSSTIGNENTQ